MSAKKVTGLVGDFCAGGETWELTRVLPAETKAEYLNQLSELVSEYPKFNGVGLPRDMTRFYIPITADFAVGSAKISTFVDWLADLLTGPTHLVSHEMCELATERVRHLCDYNNLPHALRYKLRQDLKNAAYWTNAFE